MEPGGDCFAALQAGVFPLLPCRVGGRIRTAKHVEGCGDPPEFGLEHGLQSYGFSQGVPRGGCFVDASLPFR